MSWLETLFLADVLSSDKKTAQKKIRAFVWVFFWFDRIFSCSNLSNDAFIFGSKEIGSFRNYF